MIPCLNNFVNENYFIFLKKTLANSFRVWYRILAGSERAAKQNIRVWRSLVSRLNGVQEAAGSNPVTRTIGVSFGMLRFFYPPLCYHTSYQAAAESPCIAHGSMISQYMIFYSTCHTFFRPLNRIADSHPNRQNTQAPCRRKRQGAYLFNHSKTSTLSSSPMASLMYVMVSPS